MALKSYLSSQPVATAFQEFQVFCVKQFELQLNDNYLNVKLKYILIGFWNNWKVPTSLCQLPSHPCYRVDYLRRCGSCGSLLWHGDASESEGSSGDSVHPLWGEISLPALTEWLMHWLSSCQAERVRERVALAAGRWQVYQRKRWKHSRRVSRLYIHTREVLRSFRRVFSWFTEHRDAELEYRVYWETRVLIRFTLNFSICGRSLEVLLLSVFRWEYTFPFDIQCPIWKCILQLAAVMQFICIILFPKIPMKTS